MYTVAVSYLEWIRWVATGWFRCADRVVWVEGAEDQSGIDALLDRTPDLQVSDDQGYVIACLRTDSLISGRVAGRERSVGHLWLSVAAVSSFHPLSIRGARLLEADAERAAVRLGEPVFEKSWADWRDRRLEDEAHWRGLSLCDAFGLDEPVFKEVSDQIKAVLAGVSIPNAPAHKLGFEGTRAMGWSLAMSVATSESAVKAPFKETPEYRKLGAVINTLAADFEIGRPLLSDESTVKVVQDVGVILQRLGAQVLPLELMAAVMHYRSLATGGRQLTLDALVDDLVAIALDDPQHASLAAYFIGRSMENVAVTTLLYQSEPARYAALAPSAGRKQLNVMSLAARRLEARQPVDEVQKANPGGEVDADTAKENLDATSGPAAGARVEQPMGGEQVVVDGSNSVPGDSSVVAVSATVPPGDSSVGELPTVALVGVDEPQGGATSAPSAGVGEELVQSEKSSTQPPAELFPQTMDGLEPIAAPAKGKKNRKKSDKTPEVRSAVETSDDTSDK